jgi:hypothetical protein
MRILVVTASIILFLQVAAELALWVLPGEDVSGLRSEDLTAGWFIGGAAWLTVQFVCVWVVVHQAVWGS